MNNGIIFEEHKGIEDLYGKSSNMMHLDGVKLIGFDEIIETDAQ